MGIEDIIQNYSTIIVWASHIALALYVWGDGKVMSYDASPYLALGVLAVSLFVFNKLHSAIQVSQAKEKDLEQELRLAKTQQISKTGPPPRNSTQEEPFKFEDL